MYPFDPHQNQDTEIRAGIGMSEVSEVNCLSTGSDSAFIENSDILFHHGFLNSL